MTATENRLHDALKAYEDTAQELHETQAERDDLRRKLGGECETCDGTGVMQVVDHVEAPDEKEILADAECAECNGTGKGWIAEVITEREDLRRKLADASLANAQLRQALMDAREWYERDAEQYAWPKEDIDTALALPVDGLAEEVRKYMRHTWGCEQYDNGSDDDTENRLPCTCGLDALLARLGARP